MLFAKYHGLGPNQKDMQGELRHQSIIHSPYGDVIYSILVTSFIYTEDFYYESAAAKWLAMTVISKTEAATKWLAYNVVRVTN